MLENIPSLEASHVRSVQVVHSLLWLHMPRVLNVQKVLSLGWDTRHVFLVTSVQLPPTVLPR